MKQLYTTLVALFAIFQFSYAQTALSVDGNGVLNYPQIITNTTAGQSFFTGHQVGYTYGYPAGIFRAITDNPNGADNYYFEGITNGIGKFNVRADGQGYFAGNVGIGTTNPQGKLDIYNTSNTSTTPLFSIRSNFHVPGNYGMIKFGDYTQTTDYQKGAIIYESVSGSARGKFHIALENTDGNGSVTLADAKLTVLSNGYVGIGTTTPKEALSVNGNIRSKEIKVETANWPDYVFKPQYKLPSLFEVKAYIDQNHHLPEMPSEQDVKDNGLNLGDINKLLTKKVEELTLYMIEKDRQLTDQQTINLSQQKQIDQLKTQIDLIVKSLTKN